MIRDDSLALFLLLGQTAERAVGEHPDIVPDSPLLLAPDYDIAPSLPSLAREAAAAAQAYRLFFVFENYLRELVVDVLAKNTTGNWWDSVPSDVQAEVTKLEAMEETKAWMALGSRDKSALMTYPQLLRVVDHCWKWGFEDLVRDKSLLNEARLIVHLRNTVAHMTSIPEEELNRVRQAMRDWFRVVAP